MKPQIEIGFSNNIYNNPADIVGSVQLISENFQAVEIELAEEAQPALLEATPAEYDEIVEGLCTLASERSLIYSVHAAWYGPATDLTSIDRDERLASVDLLARSIQFAADIKARIVTCHPGNHHGQSPQEVVDKLVDSINRLEDLLGNTGTTLCIENMGAKRPAHVVLNPEEQWLACERTGAAVCLDVVHLVSVYPEEQGWRNAIRTLAPLVQHVHLADTIWPAHRHLPIGKGDLQLGSIVSQLEEVGYTGDAIVEEFNRGWTPEQYLSGALEFRDRSRSVTMAR